MNDEDYDWADDAPTMDHAEGCRRQSGNAYALRASLYDDMDEATLEELESDLGGLSGYCLDAIGSIPAGGMRSSPFRPRLILMEREA